MKRSGNKEYMFFQGAHESSFQFAKEMRNNPTKAEQAMWNLLKGKQILGLKFRRQHVFENMIFDFYCHQAKLVIEIDGPYHNSDKTISEKDQSKGFSPSNMESLPRTRSGGAGGR